MAGVLDRDDQTDEQSHHFHNGIILAAAVWSIVALAATAVYFLGGQPWRLVGLAVLVLGASAALGAIGGLLFGVPKSVPYKPNTGEEPPPYEPNSNLEQVSDWLTKILIGVSLVEIRQVTGGIWGFAQRLGIAFGDTPGEAGIGAIFALTLMTVGVLTSFILVYMWVRTRLFQVLAALAQRPGGVLGTESFD